jgi:2-oxoisovalerate dehydrogenase E2 component (dihydrolipoyl transacylase)
MTIQTIKMPDIGEGIAEVELVAWHVKVGDNVAEDQILADVMTDKATVEIPSHVAGTVLSLDVTVGQVVAVGTKIIHIEVPKDQAESSSLANPSKATNNRQLASAAPPVGALAEITKVPAMPAVARAKATVQANVEPATPQANSVAGSDQRPVASPAVRHRAAELGIDLSKVAATGPAGRITQADLVAYSQSNSTLDSILGNKNKGYVHLSSEESIPVIGLRRKIAQKMQEAKRRIPHFTYVEEMDVTELEAFRDALNQEYSATRGKLTVLPILIRAMVLAVREFPEINARYDDDAGVVTRYAAVHLGLATQTAGGLMVPVIRHAEALDFWACASAIRQTSEAARTGKASRDDLTGSTLTLTSLGALGGIVSTPVINHPEVAIVGTNRIVERPVIYKGLIAARKMMNLSSSFDHRVVDGMNAAQFIQRIKRYLECPGTLLV